MNLKLVKDCRAFIYFNVEFAERRLLWNPNLAYWSGIEIKVTSTK